MNLSQRQLHILQERANGIQRRTYCRRYHIAPSTYDSHLRFALATVRANDAAHAIAILGLKPVEAASSFALAD